MWLPGPDTRWNKAAASTCGTWPGSTGSSPARPLPAVNGWTPRLLRAGSHHRMCASKSVRRNWSQRSSRKPICFSFVPRRSLRQGRLGTGLVELRCRHTTMRRTLCFLCRKGGYVSPALRRLTQRLRAAILEDQAGRPTTIDREGAMPASKRSAPPSRSRARS